MTQHRYVCSRCGSFQSDNTPARCVQCGTDTDMVLMDVTLDSSTGQYRLSVQGPQGDPRRQHGTDTRRQTPQ